MTNDIAQRGERNSSVEIFRIFAMILIIASHYSCHGNISFPEITNTFNYLFLKNITLGSLGVHIFILLFGYFSIDNESISLKKVFKLWLQVWSYSLGIFVYMTVVGKTSFSWKGVIKALFPFSFSNYWFFTAYIVFYLLSPFFNPLLRGLKKNTYLQFIIIMFFIWSVLPTFTNNIPAGGDFSLFLLLYCVGGFIRRFPCNSLNQKKIGITLFGSCEFLVICSTIAINTLGTRIKWIKGAELFFLTQRSFLLIGASIGLVLFATNIKHFHNRMINYVSSCTFGIYLLHDNSLIRSYIWEDFFHNAYYANSVLLYVHLPCTILTIFCFGVIIETIRKHTLERVGLKVFSIIEKKAKGIILSKTSLFGEKNDESMAE